MCFLAVLLCTIGLQSDVSVKTLCKPLLFRQNNCVWLTGALSLLFHSDTLIPTLLMSCHY